MKVKEIEALLNDFYEGNTTLEQEVTLRSYFESDEVPEYLLNEKYQFLSCFEGDKIEVPASMESKLEAMIDLEVGKTNKKPSGKLLRATWIWMGSVAASLVLLISIGINVYQSNQTPQMADTYSNPTDAARETRKALLLVSKNLSTGYAQLKKAETKIDRTKTILNEQLKKIPTK